MNEYERRMVEILKEGKSTYGVLGVKSEYEAEGTRSDELLRLLDIARSADVKIGLKIGGCESIRDLLDSKQIGVDYIIAPMIESPYALSKYIEAKNKVYATKYERSQIRFLFNIETITALNNLDALMEKTDVEDGVDGVVFGRVDFSLSCSYGRDEINHDKVTQSCIKVAEATKKSGRELVVGGGVALEALPALRAIKKVHLTRFETRKMIFSGEALDIRNIETGLLRAVEFEWLWLSNKRDYYSNIVGEDAGRLQMLDSRLKLLQAKAKETAAA